MNEKITFIKYPTTDDITIKNPKRKYNLFGSANSSAS
jgi:hypothetical protein